MSFRSEKIFGSLDCKSPPSPTVGVKVNQSSKWLAKIWVKYLLVEVRNSFKSNPQSTLNFVVPD